MRIAIVVSEFNGDITGRMLEAAQQRAAEMDLEVGRVCRAPGSYDMPFLVDALLKCGSIDGVATLGAIIRGQTKHDEVIAHATAASLQALSVKHGKPVSLGVSGPGMTVRQAHARIRPVARRAVEALLELHKEAGRIRA